MAVPDHERPAAQKGADLPAAVQDQLDLQARRHPVRIYLPRFKTSSTFKLGAILKRMGMPLPFSGRADFSGMPGKRGLRISEVIHKAFVEVNEQGTEAAAATATGMKAGGRPRPVPVFRADHPFTFLILDKTTSAILFFGRLLNPRS